MEQLTVLVEDGTLTGRVRGTDVTILGSFDGELEVAGVLRIGPSARVKAAVRANTVEVAGWFEGEIQAAHLRLEETAHVRGTLLANRLTIREGAILDGAVNPPSEPARAAATPEVARASDGKTDAVEPIAAGTSEAGAPEATTLEAPAPSAPPALDAQTVPEAAVVETQTAPEAVTAVSGGETTLPPAGAAEMANSPAEPVTATAPCTDTPKEKEKAAPAHGGRNHGGKAGSRNA